MPKKTKLKWADTYRNHTNCNHEQMKHEQKNMNYNARTMLFLLIPVQLLCGSYNTATIEFLKHDRTAQIFNLHEARPSIYCVHIFHFSGAHLTPQTSVGLALTAQPTTAPGPDAWEHHQGCLSAGPSALETLHQCFCTWLKVLLMLPSISQLSHCLFSLHKNTAWSFLTGGSKRIHVDVSRQNRTCFIHEADKAREAALTETKSKIFFSSACK